MKQLHYNQEKSPKRTPANAARKAFWDAAMGDNSKLANLAKAAIAEAEQQAQPDQRVTPEMFKALQDNLDVIARAHNRHVEIGEKYGLNDEAQSAEQANGREAVAWVEVVDTHEGPYNFHGKERLPKGKHNLYTTPPAQPAREWVDLPAPDTRTDAHIETMGEPAYSVELVQSLFSGLREKNAGLPATIKLISAYKADLDASKRDALDDARRFLAADDASDNAPWLTEAHILCTDHGIPMGHITERIRALREKLADDKAGGEPVYLVATGEIHEGKETYTRHDKPVPLADQEVLYTRPQPQAEVVFPDKAKNFYLAVCNFLVWIGREGTVHADDPIIDQLSNALHDIDGGVFKDSLKWPQAEVRVPDGYVLVKLGFGKVEVASGNHEGVPALIFGKNGTGIIGEATQPNRMHAEGETLACVTFANAESLEVVQHHINEVRDMLAAAPKPQAA